MNTLRRSRRRSGITLIETLTTLAILLVLLPAILEGFNIAARIAILTRQKAEATAIAQSKMDEIVSTAGWLNGSMQGDEDRPPRLTYHWEAQLTNWDSGDTQLTQEVNQLNLTVTWKYRGRDEEITLSTIVYTPVDQSQTTGGIGGGVLP